MMRPPCNLIPLLAAALLASCSSPPKPPSVDEAQRRPVNAQSLVELQVCRNDLQNTRLLAADSGRLADATAATLAQVSARQQTLALLTARALPAPDDGQERQRAAGVAGVGNLVHVLRFEFGSTRVRVADAEARALLAQARLAPLIHLRGRTDGQADNPGDSRIARERALAVRDFLVQGGVDPARIRVTYQPAGDHVAENASDSGRALNRRVEIEMYRAVPVALDGASGRGAMAAGSLSEAGSVPATHLQGGQHGRQ